MELKECRGKLGTGEMWREATPPDPAHAAGECPDFGVEGEGLPAGSGGLQAKVVGYLLIDRFWRRVDFMITQGDGSCNGLFAMI